MRLRRYCVTVMDNWTPLRFFWTFGAAVRFQARFPSGSYLFVWNGTSWRQYPREVEGQLQAPRRPPEPALM